MTVAMSTKKTKKPKVPKLVSDELIDQLLAQVENKDAESILGESGLAGLLKKQLAERMLAAELTHHLAAEAKQGRSGITATVPAQRPSSRPTVVNWNWTFHSTGRPPSSRNWWPSTSAGCPASTTT